MQFEILGPLQVRDGDRPVALGRPKQRAVLAILLLDAGRVVSLDRLVEELWGAQAPPRALTSVQAYVSHLRRLLEPDRPAGAPAKVLVNQPPGYRLAVPGEALDAARFQEQAERGHELLRAGAAGEAADVLAGALRLWRGQVLADFADAAFVRAERARLGELRLAALEARLGADLAVGRHGTVVPELEQLTAEHPFREGLRALQMVALYRGGRQAEALRAYQRFGATLRDELGLDPGPALRKLERDILRQAAELDWRPVTPARPGRTPPAQGSAGLVGRDEPLRQIEAALAGAAAGRGRVVLVSGEPGIGKTRLAEEAARRAREAGATVAWGRSDEDDGAPPFWPWTQVLRALPGDADKVLAGDGSAAPVVDLEASRFRLCQAAAGTLRRLAAGRPMLLVLDDLQWADASSLRLLSVLAAGLSDAPIVVLATYRDRPLDPDGPLAATLAGLARGAATHRIELAGLGAEDVARLMAAGHGPEPDDALAALVAGRTGGNPFFVIEVLRVLGRGDADPRQIPAGVRDVLRRRLARLPERTRTVLLVAAVAGQEFDLDVVRRATGLPAADAVDAVELAWVSGLVVEDAAVVGRFRFAHALVREAIYDGISRVRRAGLHASVGQALVDRGGGAVEHAVQIAHHWSLAAPVAGAGQAVPHVIAAAETCLRAYAYEQAEDHLRRALDLLAEAPDPAAELAVRLRLGALPFQLHGTGADEAWTMFARARDLADRLGDSSALVAACRSLYEVAFARADHRGAAALAEFIVGIAERGGDPAVLTLGHLAMGRTLWCQGHLPEARQYLDRALRTAGAAAGPHEPVPPLITVQLQLAAVLHPLGEPVEAEALVSAAVAASRAEAPFAQAAVLSGAALIAALRRDVAAARSHAAEALDLARRWHFPAPSGYAAIVLAWADALDGKAPAAIAEIRRRLDELQAGGAQHLVAWGLGLLAEANLHAGRPDEALRLLDDALARVQRTGEHLYEADLHRLRARVKDSSGRDGQWRARHDPPL